MSLPGFTGHLGSSIGSRSVSAHSGSRAGSRITSGGLSSSTVEQGSSLGHWFIGKDKLSPALRKRLLKSLISMLLIPIVQLQACTLPGDVT